MELRKVHSLILGGDGIQSLVRLLRNWDKRLRRPGRNRGLEFGVHKALDKEGSYCNDGGFCLRSPCLAALSRPDHIYVFPNSQNPHPFQ